MENFSPVRKNKSGKVIHSGKRDCCVSVYKTVTLDNPNMTVDSKMEKVADMTGISKRSVYSIVSQYKKNRNTFDKSPKNSKPRPNVFDKLDEFTKCAIRRKVHEFFYKNEPPTINKVLTSVNDDETLPNFKRSSFATILKQLNFVFERRGRNMFLADRDDIILWRRNYLKKIKKYREEKRKIYYQDETWVNEGHVKGKIWVDKSIKSKKDAFQNGLSTGLKNPSGKGRRLIVSHIGNENGFLENGSLIFQSNSNEDYHKEMNGDVFIEYFRKLLPTLEDGAVVVLDNAPYHSSKIEKLPTTSWNKTKLRNWLEEKQIPFDDAMLKRELLQIANFEKPKYDKYIVDEEAKKHKKIVLRLPPYHCELNPIELVWAQVKGYVAAHNTTFKLEDVKKLLKEGLDRVTTEKWESCVNHVKKEEEKLWKLDDLIEEMEEAEPFIINLENSDEDSDLAEELPEEN